MNTIKEDSKSPTTRYLLRIYNAPDYWQLPGILWCRIPPGAPPGVVRNGLFPGEQQQSTPET